MSDKLNRLVQRRQLAVSTLTKKSQQLANIDAQILGAIDKDQRLHKYERLAQLITFCPNRPREWYTFQMYGKVTPDTIEATRRLYKYARADGLVSGAFFPVSDWRCTDVVMG